jgi:hypothetical protein
MSKSTSRAASRLEKTKKALALLQQSHDTFDRQHQEAITAQALKALADPAEGVELARMREEGAAEARRHRAESEPLTVILKAQEAAHERFQQGAAARKARHQRRMGLLRERKVGA